VLRSKTFVSLMRIGWIRTLFKNSYSFSTARMTSVKQKVCLIVIDGWGISAEKKGVSLLFCLLKQTKCR
jgi:hypothetical protein